MKFFTTTANDVLKTSAFVKITAFSLVSVCFLFLLNHYSSTYSSLTLFSIPTALTYSVSSSPETSPAPPPPKKKKIFRMPPLPPVERTGIVDENGEMSEDFKIGKFNSSLNEDFGNFSVKGEVKDEKSGVRIRVEKYKVCEQSMSEYIPCLDNVEEIKKLNSTERGEKYERHCPEEGKWLNCLLPRPKAYRSPIPWPKSRDEMWFSNVPHTRLVEDKGGQNWISRKKDKFVFPGGGTQFIHGADQYLNQILEMVPDIAFGYRVRVALDIGCGVASFDSVCNGAWCASHGGIVATRRLLYPSQAFDMIHCSRCRVNWTHDDGILLLEVNRLLRAGGYFVWAAQPVYKHGEILQEQWKEMENLTTRFCWELVRKEGYIAIWKKPSNNSCYLSRDAGVQPPLCDSNDDPDNVWYVGLNACITKLPSTGYGANVTKWPARLNFPPDRLQTIKLDAYISRKELFKAESKYWNEIIDSYVRDYHWKEMKLRNVMDMRAGFGGGYLWCFSVDLNTLPVLYDHGLIGVMHDWCEPFDTYPRTYDLLHAAGLFSVEENRLDKFFTFGRHKCNISTIMLEMDRMLRPGGSVYIRDSVSVIGGLQEIAMVMGWAPALHETSEGPHASWKVLICEKRM
ncbi:S-adenosyl-L-methionine-dependent methyltransferases superfamily protein [Quillaja saponaria]|uniref:Methyltransferase n=1 Tax=Quillaja saponaria TaxID=32244 RepID=A0AAD7LLE3_QUISA|nr:S-adenosyl-L-methionine-dependent methyltransferases superfamily protein [Quillaja saponaria]